MYQFVDYIIEHYIMRNNTAVFTNLTYPLPIIEISLQNIYINADQNQGYNLNQTVSSIIIVASIFMKIS